MSTRECACGGRLNKLGGTDKPEPGVGAAPRGLRHTIRFKNVRSTQLIHQAFYLHMAFSRNVHKCFRKDPIQMIHGL